MTLSDIWKTGNHRPNLLCFWKLEGDQDTKNQQALLFVKNYPPSDIVGHGIIALLEEDSDPHTESLDQFEAAGYLVITVPRSLRESCPSVILYHILTASAGPALALSVSPDRGDDEGGETMTPRQEKKLLDAINDPHNMGFGPC